MEGIKIVVKVERTPCSSLGNLLLTAADRVRIPSGIQWEEIPVRTHATLSISEKMEDNVPVYTATLKFFTCKDFSERKNFAYRVTLAGGNCRLVGTGNRPFAVMTLQETMPEKASDNSWNEVTITYSSPKMIPLIA